MRIEELLTGKTTCVLMKGSVILKSEYSGIRPMLEWLGENRDLAGFSVADRIVGKAAAMLFVKAKLASVYADVLSVPGKAYLEAHGIPFAYGTLTERIINRKGNGLCPMEQTVLNMDDAEEGYLALKAKSEELYWASEKTNDDHSH